MGRKDSKGKKGSSAKVKKEPVAILAGDNVIYHGDSTKLIHKVIEDQKIDCIITDPPYGMKLRLKSATTPEGIKRNAEIDNDGDLETALAVFDKCMKRVKPFLADEAEVYVFTAWHVLDSWMEYLRTLEASHDLKLKMMLIWAKGYPGKGDLAANWGCGHEIIFYLKKGRRPIPKRRSGILYFDGDIDAAILEAELWLESLKEIKAGKRPELSETGIIPVNKIGARLNTHPTEKPVALIERLVEMSTDPGALIVDFFSGSGSTSVAAKNLGRRSIAFDTDEGYVESGIARLGTFGLFG